MKEVLEPNRHWLGHDEGGLENKDRIDRMAVIHSCQLQSPKGTFLSLHKTQRKTDEQPLRANLCYKVIMYFQVN